MQKKALSVVTVVIGLVFITCSGLDTYTTAGSEVIDEYNQDLTDFNKNFLPIALDSSIILKSGSITSQDTFLTGGIHRSLLAAGSSDGISIYGYNAFIVTESFATRYSTATTFDSITFLYDTLNGSLYESESVLDTTARLYLTASTRSELYDRIFPNTSEEQVLCTLKPSYLISSDDTIALQFSGKCDVQDLTDSIFTLLSTFIQCAEDEDNNQCSDISDTLFSMALYAKIAPVWFYNQPAMIIHSRTEGNTTTYSSDTIYATSSFYMVKENDSLSNAYTDLPVSSYNTGRIAVFTVDLSEFWDSTTQSDFNEILSAVLVVEPDTLVNGSLMDACRIQYVFTDSIITDFGEFLTYLSSFADLSDDDNEYRYNYHYQNISMDTCLSTNSIDIPLSSHLQRNRENPNDTYYLYLQIESTNISAQQEVLWKKPQFKAILTTTK